MSSLPVEDLGGNEIGLKKGGRVDETELNAGENEDVASRTALRLELFGSELGVRFKSDGWLDISKPVSDFCPTPLLLELLDTLFREIFRLIASKRSCFSSSRGLDGSSTGLRVVISDWVCSSFETRTPLSSADCFTTSSPSLPSDPSKGVSDGVANADCEIVDDCGSEDSVVVDSGNIASVDFFKSGDELLLLDFVTWVGSECFVEDLRVDVDGSVPLNSSVVDTRWIGWLRSEDAVIGFVVVVVVVVVGLVLTTTVDGDVGSCIGVVRTIFWYSTSSGYCRAFVVLTMSWYSKLSWYCCAFVVRTMSWYSSLPLSILSVVVVPRVLLELVGTLLVLLRTRSCPPTIPDLAAEEGCWEAAGCVEFTLELTGRRIFRLRIRSRFDGLCGASSSCRGDLVVD